MLALRRGFAKVEVWAFPFRMKVRSAGSPAYHFSTPTSGNLGIYHRNTGTTVLSGTLNHRVDTMVVAGTLVVNGGLASSVVKPSVTGTVAGTGQVSRFEVADGGTLAPGDPTAEGTRVGTLRSALHSIFGPGGRYVVDIADWAGVSAGTHWDRLLVTSLANTATPEAPFVIKVSGPAANFQETAKSLAIVQKGASGAIPNPTNIIVDDADFPGTGTWSVRRSTTYLYLDYTPGTETPFQEWARQNGLPAGENGTGDDADKDGMNNLGEFALDRDPNAAGEPVKQDVRTMSEGGFPSVYFTIPVRSGAVFSGSPALVSGPAGGVTYRIEAGTDLAGWSLPVTEVTGGGQLPIQALMPPLSNANWTYRTFRTVPDAILDEQFIRCRVEGE